MSISPGTLNALKLAGGWCLGAVLVAGTLVYRDEIFSAGGAVSGSSELTQQSQSPSPSPQPRAEPVRRVAEVEDTRSSRLGSERMAQIRPSAGGHHRVRAYINGRSVDVLVDTGATVVALSYEDARAAGLRLFDSDFTHESRTANGRARVAPVMLDNVSIGEVSVSNVRAVVFEESNPIGTTLLGMSFLGRLSKFEIRQGVLTLIE